MSRSSSRHKPSKRLLSSSRPREPTNGYSSLASKYNRHNLSNGLEDPHRRDRRHRSRDYKRSHRHSSRRSPSGLDESRWRHRSRHSSGDLSPRKNNNKRSGRKSTAKQLSYSTSATRSPIVNKVKAPACGRNPHSMNSPSATSSSLSPSVHVIPKTENRVNRDDAVAPFAAAAVDCSPWSFSPPPIESPASPTSSFGVSFFEHLSTLPVKRSQPSASADVYTPDLLSLLGITKQQLSASAVKPVTRALVNDVTDNCVGIESDEDVVQMEVSSSPPAQRSPVASPLMPLGEHTFPQVNRSPGDGKLAEGAPADRSRDGFLSGASSMSGPSAGIEVSKATKAHNQRLQAQRNKLMPLKRITLPPLHLHMSKDGTSPLPPGWQRAPAASSADVNPENTYAYYYYHTKTRQTRWDPPIYPWDADPEDNLIPDRPLDDPEAPYNWGCAHRYAITHEEIETMYNQYRVRILERQCMEMIHEMGSRPDVPQGAQEQGFAIELFSLIHNGLREFRDARVNLGRITNDEDLFFLTNKLAQVVIPKEIRTLHRAQQANASSLFSAITPEVTPAIRDRAVAYVRRYMEAKGPYYRRCNVAPAPPQHHQQVHGQRRQSCNNNNNNIANQ